MFQYVDVILDGSDAGCVCLHGDEEPWWVINNSVAPDHGKVLLLDLRPSEFPVQSLIDGWMKEGRQILQVSLDALDIAGTVEDDDLIVTRLTCTHVLAYLKVRRIDPLGKSETDALCRVFERLAVTESFPPEDFERRIEPIVKAYLSACYIRSNNLVRGFHRRVGEIIGHITSDLEPAAKKALVHNPPHL